MNRNQILEETIELANEIYDKSTSKETIELYLSIQNLEKYDKYKFLSEVKDFCHRKKISIPSFLGRFLTYDDKLQKDIVYTFVVNFQVKNHK